MPPTYFAENITAYFYQVKNDWLWNGNRVLKHVKLSTNYADKVHAYMSYKELLENALTTLSHHIWEEGVISTSVPER